jgi:nucleotide-binding universal stress UspA family protein
MLILAEALTRQTPARRVYALKLLRPTERTSNLVGEAQADSAAALQSGRRRDSGQLATATFGPLLGQADGLGLELRPVSFVSSQPARDICGVAELKGADLILLGWHRPLFNRAALGGTVNDVLEKAASDVAVLVDRGLSELRRVLVPYHGTPDDLRALALARRLCEQSAVEVTVLHVVPPGRAQETGNERRRGVHAQVGEVFREPGSAGGDGPRVTVKVVEDSQPAEAALRETSQRDGGAPYDLVLVGVGSDWGLEQRQFGINQEYFIRKCPASLLVVRARADTPAPVN